MDPRSSGKLSSHPVMHMASSLSQTLISNSPKVVTSPTLPTVTWVQQQPVFAHATPQIPLDPHSLLPHHTSQVHAHHFNWQFLTSTLTHRRILPEAFWSVWWHKHIHRDVWCTCRQSQIPPHQFFLVPGTPSCSGKPYCSLSEDISTRSQKQQRQVGVERPG